MKVIVKDAIELIKAINNKDIKEIRVEGKISGMSSFSLKAGVKISGGELIFKSKGLGLTKDNTISNLKITSPETEMAIFNNEKEEDWGTLEISNVETHGQVHIFAQNGFKKGNIVIKGLDVITADVRGREKRPHKYGVDVLQGALTVYNATEEKTTLRAEVQDVSVGRKENPVRGSGILISGNGDFKENKGTVTGKLLTTNEIFSDGGIEFKTPDLIAGGVFLSYGVGIDTVINNKEVTTYGNNDMILDLWGDSKTWTVKERLESYGGSAIGFVLFGNIDKIVMQKILTHGQGARGFNLYDGSIKELEIKEIKTEGDASTGIQISKPMGSLAINGSIITYGNKGTSLVKGVITPQRATALSIKEGGVIESVHIKGDMITNGDDAPAFENHGKINKFVLEGEMKTLGETERVIEEDITKKTEILKK